jgi:hypothetical protein
MTVLTLFRKNSNQQAHLHLSSCRCRISSKHYELAGSFQTLDEAQMVWQIRNDYGTVFHNCLINFVDKNGRRV